MDDMGIIHTQIRLSYPTRSDLQPIDVVNPQRREATVNPSSPNVTSSIAKGFSSGH